MEVKAYVTNGDLGSGEPGSLQWHKCAVAELTRDQLIEYVREAFRAMSDVDKLEFTVFLIREKLNDGNSHWDSH